MFKKISYMSQYPVGNERIITYIVYDTCFGCCKQRLRIPEIAFNTFAREHLSTGTESTLALIKTYQEKRLPLVKPLANWYMQINRYRVEDLIQQDLNWLAQFFPNYSVLLNKIYPCIKYQISINSHS